MISNSFVSHNPITLAVDATSPSSCNFNLKSAAVPEKKTSTNSARLRLQTEKSLSFPSNLVSGKPPVIPAMPASQDVWDEDSQVCPSTPRMSSRVSRPSAGSTSTKSNIPFPTFAQVTPSAQSRDFHFDDDYYSLGTEEKKIGTESVSSHSFHSFPSFFQQVTGNSTGDSKRKLNVEGSLLDLSDVSSSPTSDPEMKKMRKLSLDDSNSMLGDHLVLRSVIGTKEYLQNTNVDGPPPTPSIRRSRASSKAHLVTPSRISFHSNPNEEESQWILSTYPVFAATTERTRSISYDEQELEVPKVLVSSSYVEMNKPCPVLGEDILVQDIIGTGAFAEVMKVRFVNSHAGVGKCSLFALKRLKKAFRSMKDRERIVQEAHMMKKFSQDSNPYIIDFHGAWQCDGKFHILMEFSERGSVKDLIYDYHSRGTMIPDSTIWHVVHDVCSALTHIHNLGYVHLDIKPANLLLFEDGMIKVCDFGLVTSIGINRDEQEGDPRYMAKELLNDNIRDSSADIFSLGISLYEMASIHNHPPSSLNHITPRPIFTLPTEGFGWHELRNGINIYVANRPFGFNLLLLAMMNSVACSRPKAVDILTLPDVQTYKLEPELMEIYASTPTTTLIKPVFNRSSSFEPSSSHK